MRILCSTSLSPSNARALMPLARAAVDAGHEVLVVSPPDMASAFEGERIPVVARLTDMSEIVLNLLQRQRIGVASPDPFAVETLVQTTCGPHVSDSYRAILEVAKEFEPDVVVRSGIEFGAVLVAETLGIPHIAAPSGGGQYLDPALVLAELDERRAELGLPPGRSAEDIHAHGRFDCMPAEYSFAAHGSPETFSYQQPADVVSTETRPGWLDDLPTDRPLVVVSSTNVFASLMTGKVFPRLLDLFLDGLVAGHLFEMMPGIDVEPDLVAEVLSTGPTSGLEPVVEGLSRVDCTAVVATRGMPVDRSVVGDNVHLFDRIPQPLLLQSAALLVNHGGYNSVRESIRAGVPMALLPQLSDQGHNAHRVVELGMGLRVGSPDPAAVAETCTTLLEDPRFTDAAREGRRRMLALPTVDAAVAHLAGLTAR